MGRGAGGRAMSSFDEQSRWETETVSTTKSGKSKSSKRGKSKERKRRIDFSLIEEAVKVSDVYGHSWYAAACEWRAGPWRALARAPSALRPRGD